MSATTTRLRTAAELREELDRIEHLMTLALGTPMHATYLAQRGDAMRELRQMGETR